MKKRTFQAFLMMIPGIFLLGYFTMWWLPAIWIMLVVFVMKLDIKRGMLTGGISFGIVWLTVAIYMSGQDVTGIISKTGALFGGLSPLMMLILVTVISLITGSLAGWFGSALGLQVGRNHR